MYSIQHGDSLLPLVGHSPSTVISLFPLGDDSLNTCRIHFDLSFEFRNPTHARITHLFFDKVFSMPLSILSSLSSSPQVVQQQVSAFLDRARTVHGPPSRSPSPPEILRYEA